MVMHETGSERICQLTPLSAPQWVALDALQVVSNFGAQKRGSGIAIRHWLAQTVCINEDYMLSSVFFAEC